MTTATVPIDDPRVARIFDSLERRVERDVARATVSALAQLAAIDRGDAVSTELAPTRERAEVPAWVAAMASRISATVRHDVAPEDILHELSEALEDEILGHAEVVAARAKLETLLDRAEALDQELAAELEAHDFDHYCAIVRATLAAVLARQAVPA